MHFHSMSAAQTLELFGVKKEQGLSLEKVKSSVQKYGINTITKQKRKSIFSKILSALLQPMILILIFGFIVAFGSRLGTFIKTGETDFSECIGIVLAITLSVAITLIMEGSSEKAFQSLNKLYDNIAVKVIREGVTITISQKNVVVGDVIMLDVGDKVIADGRLIESNSLTVDESALTGESHPSSKDCAIVLPEKLAIAERKNFVYSGTFIKSGSGKMIVTAVGDNTEMGKIAGKLLDKKEGESPLNQKLNRLGKVISIIGIVFSLIVFCLSLVRLYLQNQINFENVQSLFISCIILIIAAVPEGLPTIVAVSLALNMIKLAREDAIIKKMIATETMGAVSVICSDKTGTLTQNKMTLSEFCFYKDLGRKNNYSEEILQNFVINSRAELIKRNGQSAYVGSGTECALLDEYVKSQKVSYAVYRNQFKTISVVPFSSEKKYMITQIYKRNGYRLLIKGAPERILDRCNISLKEKEAILSQMKKYQEKAERVIAFAHKDNDKEELNLEEVNDYTYDGFAVISDPIRKDVAKAILDCYSAGIGVKILTGDNKVTAFAIAKKLKVATDESQVIDGALLDELDDNTVKELLNKITVIARSSPMTKLRVVKLLKEKGEVVAVTGDGINDAPAIKHADIGIAMGRSGSEITKESADAILLNDSFSTIVKAVAFGRNVYKNLQRFILFQLSVNLSGLLFITACALIGLETPFNTLQLLWINVIMDGPPALTLGLEKAGRAIMKNRPVKRTESIVSKAMLFRIIFNGIFIAVIILMQYAFNFLEASVLEKKSAIFTLFIMFQLFNAFNCREIGSESIVRNVGRNKVMTYTFLIVLLLHIFIVEVCYSFFNISKMRFVLWIKCVIVAFSIVIVSELFKLIYRLVKRK